MKPAAAAASTILIGLALTGCSQVSTAPDEIALHYKGGPFSSTKFANCVDPGNRNTDGAADKHYTYSVGQRTYNFSGGDGTESEPITVVSKDGIEMKEKGIVTFTLNTGDCEKLRLFHEKVGIKYQAWNGGGDNKTGWSNFLRDYMGQPLDRAADAAALEFNALDVWSNTATKDAYEEKVKQLFPAFAKEQAQGDEYFGQINLTIQKPELPENIVTAISAKREAIERNSAQKEQNARALTELEQLAAAKKILGPEWAVIYKLGNDGKVQILPVPQGANVTVTK